MSRRHWRFLAWSLVLALPLALARADDEADEDAEVEPAVPAAPESTAPATKEEQYFEMMRIFADTFEQVERNYVKEVDRRKLIEAALRGMMDELDPYSNYISPDDLARFNVQVEQEFGGIGIQVTVDVKTRRLTVTSPLPGTPAYKAGVRAGDTIMEINGKTTEKMTINDAVKILKGKIGDEVTIGVLHAGGSQVEQLKMQRDTIHVPSVKGDKYRPDGTWDYMLDPERKIGYIRMDSGFGRNTASELKAALTDLKSQGMQGLVLDLRFNPGGLLTTATEVADLFLEQGKIVTTKGRNTEERTAYARKTGTFSGFPMAILVNKYSASASEIVSAALQDHKRAVIVGERTWGKGSVQNVINLEEGKSAIKLTTSSYHRPSGKNIHRFPDHKETDEWGVMPDDGYVIPFEGNEDMSKFLEYRLQREVLSQDGPPKSDYVDRQLAKGVEYISSQLSSETKTDATAKADSTPPQKDSAPPQEKDSDAPGAGRSESNARETLRRLRSLPRELVEFPILAA